MEGYELIGAWNVSIAIPKEARETLQTYFDLLKERRVPLPVLLSDFTLLNKAVELMRESKTPEESLEACVELGTRRHIPGLRHSAVGSRRLSYFEHYMACSTIELVENPFVPVANLYGGQNFPVRDFNADPPWSIAKRRIGNPGTMEDSVMRLSNGEAWWGMVSISKDEIARWRSYGFPVPSEALGVTAVAVYKFQVVMDWQKLEARIKPLPAVSKGARKR